MISVVPPPGQVGMSVFATTESTVATDESLDLASSYTDLTTSGPAVTITVPASGKVIVTVTAFMYNANANEEGGSMAFALTGANTVAATDTMRLYNDGGFTHADNAAAMQTSARFLVTGLSPGSTTFTAKYKNNGGSTFVHFANRNLRVEPVDADNFGGGSPAFPTTSAVVATSESTTSSSYTDLATVGPSITITVPASGNVRLSIYGVLSGQLDTLMSWAASGANTIAASDDNALFTRANIVSSGSGIGWSMSRLLTGLTPGSTTFTAKYRGDGTDTSTFSNRRMLVEPVDGDKA